MSHRTTTNEGIWIDVPCIDQNNKSEKIPAIDSMDVVFRAARRLVLVLGDVQLSEADQIAAMRCNDLFQELAVPGAGSTLFNRMRERFNPTEDEYAAAIRFLCKILAARWFRRAWCTHEISTQNR